jgi:hypothetical protein
MFENQIGISIDPYLCKPSPSSSHFATFLAFHSIAFTTSPPFSQPHFAIPLQSFFQAFIGFPIYLL